MQKACRYLWSVQGNDGGWHSTTHGILKGGQSLTPFILWHLLQVDQEVSPCSGEAVRSALQFLRRSISESNSDEIPLVLEYPNYAAAYTLRVFRQFGETADSIYVHALCEHLIGQQFVAQRGIFPNHPAYGGWGFGETGLPVGTAGHVDISHTRRVIQALADVLPEQHPALLEGR